MPVGAARTRADRELLGSVRSLDAADASTLRLGWWSRFDEAELRAHLQERPGRSVWIPETLEYAVVCPWRRRDDISVIAELSAIRHPELLVEAATRRAAEFGDAAVVMVELDESRRPSFYEKVGLDLLQEVITYELLPGSAERDHCSRAEFRVADFGRAEDRQWLAAIDEASFPWIWRNSVAEFEDYAEGPGVELFVVVLNGEAIGYLGLTAYLGWGHIDRVAIIPSQQGRGFGTGAVRFAICRLRQSGAKRIGLSTQRDNMPSRTVYEKLGFRGSSVNDYKLYGRLLRSRGEAAGMERRLSSRDRRESRSRAE